MTRIFIYKSKSLGVFNSNLKHLFAELNRIVLKPRLGLLEVNSAQSLETLISVTIDKGVDVYNKCMADGKLA